MSLKPITIMGIFVVDVSFRTPRLPVWGETALGSEVKLGPGGKGSNQSVAVARLGHPVSFITKIGQDAFGRLGEETYAAEGVDTTFVVRTRDFSTGAAAILVDEVSGENAIVVTAGAANALTHAEIDAAADQIRSSSAFVTQLELPLPAVTYGLEKARGMGVVTILNPAPACELTDSLLALCDYVTPNETEAEILSGQTIATVDDARKAAAILLQRGARNVVLTLGAKGALLHNHEISEHVPAFHVDRVVDTTGAGDAFNGGFAVALAEGRDLLEAVRFGCAVAAISVTRPGTAPSMPSRAEADALMNSGATA